MMFIKPKRIVTRVFLHCSASDAEHLSGQRLVDEIRKWHLARKFSDVGYHYLIDKAGKRMLGRPISKMPASAKGHNARTIAICVHGLDIEKFTPESLAACKVLCAEINEAYQGRITFHGHCEVSNKTCPVYDYTALLGLDRFGRMPA